MSSIGYKELIKRKANELGFFYCGVSRAEFLEKEAPRLEEWLKAGKHGKMSYMEGHFDKRLDPRLLVPGAKSVISLLLNYYPEKEQRTDSLKISKYAYGQDYHHVIKNKLKELLNYLIETVGAIEGRVFVDSAPVMDKAWAERSGLGWIGKNSNLINPRSGSFFFIAELILDLELEPDGPMKDYCGTCTRCIDACPTDAISEPYVVEGSKCISYLTIELKDKLLPGEFKDKMEHWIFGCDICQDVCPWNRFSKATNVSVFQPDQRILNYSKSEWMDISEEIFNDLFKLSAIKRTKFTGLKRNIEFLI